MFLKVRNTHRKTSVLKPLFNNVASLKRKRLQHRCFSVNIAKSLRTPFLIEHLRWLLLHWQKSVYLKFLNVFVQFGGLQYLLNVIIIKKRDFKKLYEPARTGQEEDLGKSFQTNLIAFNDTVIVRSCDFKNNRIPPYQLWIVTKSVNQENVVLIQSRLLWLVLIMNLLCYHMTLVKHNISKFKTAKFTIFRPQVLKLFSF